MPERSDISVRGLAIGAAIVLAGIVASLGFAWFFTEPVEAPKVQGTTLQTSPRQDLAAFRREKNARLASSGRVDSAHMHIPIERAMQMLAQERER
jgi:hypothetical protein